MRFPVIPTILLLLSLIGALVVLPHSLVPPPERALLTTLLMDKSNMQVKLGGDIRLRFLPRPQIILTDVDMTGSTEAGDLIAVSVPRLVVNLDWVALGQQRFDVASVVLLYPQVTAKLVSALHDLVARMQSGAHPGLRVKKGQFTFQGLNPFDSQKSLQLPALTVDVPPRQAGQPLAVQISHAMPDSDMARGKLELGVPFGGRYDLRADIRLGAGEKIIFDGFLATRNDWQLDGELAFASNGLLAETLQYHLPLSLQPSARYVAFEGLVRGNKSGLQSGNLEVSALGAVFQTRLALRWPQEENEIPRLVGRMSTGTLNLDNVSLKPSNGEQADMAPPLVDNVWRGLANRLAVSWQMEANRFDLAGESGSNFSLDFDRQDGLIDIERMSLDLPFRSALIATGTLNVGQDSPSFNGSFSARSLDTLAALIWVGDQMAQDFSAMAELVDDAGLQRTSLVSDIEYSADTLRLSSMSGRVGNDRFAGALHVVDGQGPRLDVELQFDRFDLTDWGVAEAGNARDVDVNSVWQPVNRLLEAQLAEAAPQRLISLDFRAGQLYFGTTAIGPVILRASVKDRLLDLNQLILSDIDGARLAVLGQLDYAVSPVAGRLTLDMKSETLGGFADPLLNRLAPLRFVSNAPLDLRADVLLTDRNAMDWPNTKLVGEGTLGDMRLLFEVVTPSRTLDYSVAGSTSAVQLQGPARQLADFLLLPDNYQAAQTGRLKLELAAQSNSVSALNGSLQLANDSLELTGALRPSADGAQLEGAVSVDVADGLPLMGLSALAKPVPLSLRSQLTATGKNIGFSGMEGAFGSGVISGDGVVQLATEEQQKPQLNARLAIDDVAFDWLMPRFGKAGWSAADMRWPLFELGNAELDFQLNNARFGHVPISRMASRLRLIDGVLEAPQVDITLLDGTMTGSLQAEGGKLTPLFNLEASFNDLSPASPLLAHFGNRVLDAKMSGTMTLRGRGASAAAMMSSLDGDMQFEVGRGVLAFIDMPGLKDDLADKLNGEANDALSIVKKHIGNGEAGFERGIGLVQMRAGRADDAAVEFVFKRPYGDARLAFDADIVSRQLAAQFALYPQVDRPVLWQLSGDIAAPNISIDASAYQAVPPATVEPATTEAQAAQAATAQ